MTFVRTASSTPSQCRLTIRATFLIGCRGDCEWPTRTSAATSGPPSPGSGSPTTASPVPLIAHARTTRNEASTQRRERSALPLRQVPATPRPQVARLHQPVVALLPQGPVLRPPNLVDRRPQVLRHVEPVERDQRLRVLAHRPDVGRPHVHRHHLDPPAARIAHRVEVAVQDRAGTPVRHVQHARLRRRQVVDDRHVLVPPLERRLVPFHYRRCAHRAPRQSPPNRPFLDPRHLVPAQPALAGHRREARHRPAVDHHRLEQRRETPLRLRPRHPHLLDPVLETPNPQHFRPHQRSVLHRVQMPPLPPTSVVPRTRGTARRADQRLAREPPRPLSRRPAQRASRTSHTRHGRSMPKQLLVESRLGHPASVPPAGRIRPGMISTEQSGGRGRRASIEHHTVRYRPGCESADADPATERPLREATELGVVQVPNGNVTAAGRGQERAVQ